MLVHDRPDIDSLPSAASLVKSYQAGRKQRRRWLQSLARASIIAVSAGFLTGLADGLWNGVSVGVAAFLIALGVFLVRLKKTSESQKN